MDADSDGLPFLNCWKPQCDFHSIVFFSDELCWALIKLRKVKKACQHMASGLQLAVSCDRFVLKISNETIFGRYGWMLRMKGHRAVAVAVASGWMGIASAQCSHTLITAHLQHHPLIQICNNLFFLKKESKRRQTNHVLSKQVSAIHNDSFHPTTKAMLTNLLIINVPSLILFKMTDKKKKQFCWNTCTNFLLKHPGRGVLLTRPPQAVWMCFEIQTQVRNEFPECLFPRAEKWGKNCCLKPPQK